MHRNPLQLFIIMLLLACNKKDNFIPCKSEDYFKAGFTIFQKLEDTVVAADTIFLNSYIQLSPDTVKGTNLWRINSTDFIDSSISPQIFIADGVNSQVAVSLEQTYLKNYSCGLPETTTSSVSKSFYIIDFSNSPIKGRYNGAVVGNESDTLTITIQYFSSPSPNYFLSNLPKGCTRTTYTGYPSEIGYSLNVGYSFFSFEQSTCLPNITHGFGLLKGADSISITYSAIDSSNSNNLIKKTFLGKRIL